MSSALIVLLEVTLVLGASLGLAVFDLVSTRRQQRIEAEEARAGQPEQPGSGEPRATDLGADVNAQARGGSPV
jgi:hypothetical protein